MDQGEHHYNAGQEGSNDDTLESDQQGRPGDGHAPHQEDTSSPIASLQPLPTASGIVSRPTHPTPNNNNRPPPRRVDHTYRDYSGFPVEDIPEAARAPANFPSKLHQILSTPEYCHIISWMPHGRAWKIHDKDGLVKEVIPKYFAQSKYESFTRQLNGWGFKRLHQSGNDFNAYYHECLLRGLPHLTSLIRRAEPNKGKLLPHVEGEPNFYEISRQHPLLPPTQKAVTMPYQHQGGQYDHYSPPPQMQPSAGHGDGPPQPGYYPSYPGGAHPHPSPAHYGHGPHSADASYMSHPPAGHYPPYPPPYYPTHQYHEPTTAREPHPRHHVPHPLGPPPHGHPNGDTPYGHHMYGPPPPHCGVPLQRNPDGLDDVEDPPSPSNDTASPEKSEKVPSAPASQGSANALQGAASAQDDEWAPESNWKC